MIEIFKNVYGKVRFFYHRLQLYYSVNWTKHCILILKFPYPIAKQLPVFFYGKVKFTSITGTIKIEGITGMIGFGQP
jgi:hypothetical protein